jgi:hypothetical protein
MGLARRLGIVDHDLSIMPRRELDCGGNSDFGLANILDSERDDREPGGESFRHFPLNMIGIIRKLRAEQMTDICRPSMP